jgi:hypothetical protein
MLRPCFRPRLPLRKPLRRRTMQTFVSRMMRTGLLRWRGALERVSRVEAENSTSLSSARADSEGLAQKIVLLEDELVGERRAWEASKRKHQEHFEELTLLRTQGSKLCCAIVGPPRARHLSKGMRLAVLCHTEIVRELAAFWVMVSSAMELVLECSHSKTTHAEVVGVDILYVAP